MGEELPIPALLTKTVVAVMSQYEAIKASAAVVARHIPTVVDTASIEFIFTLINV